MNKGLKGKKNIYIYNKEDLIVWEGTSGTKLFHGSKDVSAIGTTNYLYMLKSNGDNHITYVLENMDLKIYNIFFDTLYIYNSKIKNDYGLHGWYLIGKGNYKYYSHIDSLTYLVEGFCEGIYKYDDGLKKISNDANYYNIIRENEIKGLYYIPPPGLGVEKKYSLKDLEEKIVNESKK